jgi:hypothetical protein
VQQRVAHFTVQMGWKFYSVASALSPYHLPDGTKISGLC